MESNYLRDPNLD